MAWYLSLNVNANANAKCEIWMCGNPHFSHICIPPHIMYLCRFKDGKRARREREIERVQERCSKVCSLKISFIHIFHMNARKPRSSRIYSDLTLQPLVWGRHAFFFDIFLKPRFGLILWYFKWKFLLLEVALVNVILQSNAVVSFSEYVPVLVCVRLSIERI